MESTRPHEANATFPAFSKRPPSISDGIKQFHSQTNILVKDCSEAIEQPDSANKTASNGSLMNLYDKPNLSLTNLVNKNGHVND